MEPEQKNIAEEIVKAKINDELLKKYNYLTPTNLNYIAFIVKSSRHDKAVCTLANWFKIARKEAKVLYDDVLNYSAQLNQLLSDIYPKYIAPRKGNHSEERKLSR